VVIDQKGVVWAQGAGCGLISADPVTKQVNKYNPPWGYSAYGINVDSLGRIWLGGSTKGVGAISYDPKNGAWMACEGVPTSAGIATANDGFVYVAHDCGGGVGKIDGNACWNNNGKNSYFGVNSTGGCPHGVAIDFDGFVWGVNWQGNSVGKVDPKNWGAPPVVRQIGSSPYTYSDMTGYTLNYFTAPKGLYTVTLFANGNNNPVSMIYQKQKWQEIIIDADLPAGTSIKIRYKSADTKQDLENASWSDATEFPPNVSPYDISGQNVDGNLLTIELQLLTTDKKITPILKSITAKAKGY
jgi:hypothetical protein